MMQLKKYLKSYSLLLIIIFIIITNDESYSQKDDTLIYIVQKNESVFNIAERFNIDYHVLMVENSLKEHYVKKGQELKIKGIKTLPYKEKFIYEVKPNDDVNKISKKFSLNPDKIISDNKIKNPYLLVIGTKLVLENDIKPKFLENKISINPIVKKEIYHISQKGESLYSISQKYNKNFSEILYLNKNIKKLYSNQKVLIDRFYKLNTSFNGLILNIGENKLYVIKGEKYRSYNVLSVNDNFELYKEYKVEYKIKNPDRKIDKNILLNINIADKNDLNSKLGSYWIGLDWFGKGIHCVNGEKSKSFSYSNKTIRLSRNDAYNLFSEVNLKDKFIVINEPIKVFIEDNNVFLEVYPDPSNKFDYESNIKRLTSKFKVNQDKINNLILTKTGKKEKISF